jgi:hypothetical protein
MQFGEGDSPMVQCTMVGGSGHNQASTTRRGASTTRRGGNQSNRFLHDASWREPMAYVSPTTRRGASTTRRGSLVMTRTANHSALPLAHVKAYYSWRFVETPLLNYTTTNHKNDFQKT